jgi:hypothetical protein
MDRGRKDTAESDIVVEGPTTFSRHDLDCGGHFQRLVVEWYHGADRHAQEVRE